MDTRTTVSSTIRQLMIDQGMNFTELASSLGISPSYMPRKIYEGRWNFDDLDRLAEIFGLEPADIVRGYHNIKENQ